MRKSDPAKVQEQRERILQAALKCFARKGVHGTSTDDICRAANVSSGTLYYYFKSRDGLLHDLIVYAHAMRDQVMIGLEEAPSLLDAVIDMQYASLEVLENFGITTTVYLELLAYASRNEAAGAAFQDASAQVIAVITDAVRAHQRAGKLPSDIPADALALFMPVAVTGMTIAEIADGNFDRHRYRDAFAALLYRDAPKVEQAVPTKRPARARR
jgi:TetR/AcrR family transcriptional repressor of uid operon